MKSKNIVLFILIIAIIAAIWYLESTKTNISLSPSSLSQEAVAPELTGIAGYINANPGIKIADFRGKVVLIDFWTYTCINCIRTLPQMVEWDKKYQDKGLVIIGVHTPEFEFEKKYDNVKAAVERFGIQYRVVQDNEYATWNAFQNRYWPAKYLLDKEGHIRYTHFGEGNYEETEQKIRELLGENTPTGSSEGTITDRTPYLPTTPELYLGYSFALPRGQNVGNEQGLQPQRDTDYALPEQQSSNRVYLQGLWRSNADNIQAGQQNSLLSLRFTASQLNMVADANKSTQMEVLLNERPISPQSVGKDIQVIGEKTFLTVSEPRLYNLINGPYGEYELQLRTENGLRINSFTFG